MGLWDVLHSISKDMKAQVQLASKIEERVDGLVARVADSENDVKDIYRHLAHHGERLARLETGEKTLEERLLLRIERALRPPGGGGPDSLPPVGS